MSYRIYSGDKKSLVFPIMGDGYVHLDYSKHIPTGSEDPYGLWGHDSSFTIEGIITPYDINGFSWALGADYNSSDIPEVESNVDAGQLELPFNNKYFSAVGNVGDTSSRSSDYFSHEKVAYLGKDINNSEIVEFIKRFVNHDKLFERALLKKIRMFYEALNWTLPVDKINTLERFF